MAKYDKVLLKLSGESLMGEQGYGIDESRLHDYALQIAELTEMGVKVAIVIGGGNIFRGLSGAAKGFDRVKGDQMGMLATIINSLALQSELESLQVDTKLYTAIRMKPVGELYAYENALNALDEGKVVIIAGGTGNPYFTTDTASALRGVELKADIFLKGTRVDGIYSADPEKDPNATKFKSISFDDLYDKKLRIMDLTASTLCEENNLPIYVFNMDKKGNLKKVLEGEEIGTLVHK